MTPNDLVLACRAGHVPAGPFGFWSVAHVAVPARATEILVSSGLAAFGTRDYTVLRRLTWGSLLKAGEVVMEDTPYELRKHLPILLAAHGRVLITGLGLGCVVRGLLTRPEVDHIDVIEIDEALLTYIGWEFAKDPRVTLHHGDAETIELDGQWDFAWHDVWSEKESLQLIHTRLMVRWLHQCQRQGAWELPRFAKRNIPKELLIG